MDIFQVLLSLSKIALHLRDMSKILYAHLECFSKDFLQIAFEQNKEIMSLHKLKKGFFYLQNIMIRRERINPFTWSSKHSSFLFVSFFAWTWQKKNKHFIVFTLNTPLNTIRTPMSSLRGFEKKIVYEKCLLNLIYRRSALKDSMEKELSTKKFWGKSFLLSFFFPICWMRSSLSKSKKCQYCTWTKSWKWVLDSSIFQVQGLSTVTISRNCFSYWWESLQMPARAFLLLIESS